MHEDLAYGLAACLHEGRAAEGSLNSEACQLAIRLHDGHSFGVHADSMMMYSCFIGSTCLTSTEICQH
jgi:uncharacterized iron-regulated membrane protein